jgi:hypothetical protein
MVSAEKCNLIRTVFVESLSAIALQLRNFLNYLADRKYLRLLIILSKDIRSQLMVAGLQRKETRKGSVKGLGKEGFIRV